MYISVSSILLLPIGYEAGDGFLKYVIADCLDPVCQFRLLIGIWGKGDLRKELGGLAVDKI